MALTSLPGIAIGVLGVYILWKVLSPKKNGTAPLPPGPKGKPVIGNLLDLPAPGEQEWQHWLKHKSLYGLFLTAIVQYGLALRKLCNPRSPQLRHYFWPDNRHHQ